MEEIKISELALATDAQVSNAFDLIVSGRSPNKDGEMTPRSFRISMNDDDSPILRSRVFKKFRTALLSDVDERLALKEDKSANKGLSSNDFTNSMKAKVEGLGSLSSIGFDPTQFVIEDNELKLLSINPDNISWSSEFRSVTDAEKSTWNSKQDAVNFSDGLLKIGSTVKIDTASIATKDFVLEHSGAVYHFKGSCLKSELPASGEVGDAYFTSDEEKNYAWNGEEWKDIGFIVDVSEFIKTADARNEFVAIEAFNILNSKAVKLDGNQNISGVKTISGVIDITGSLKINGVEVEIPTDKGRIAGCEDIKVQSVNNKEGVVILTTDDISVGPGGKLYVSSEEKLTWNAKQKQLTSAQLAATGSGITAEKVSKYDEYANQLLFKQDIIEGVQKLALESGITSSKVAIYDAHLGNTAIHLTAADRENVNNIPNKQDKLTDAQMIAVNSGITESKVNKITELATVVPNKQDKLDASQMNAVNSGITSEKVQQISDIIDAQGNFQPKITGTTELEMKNLLLNTALSVGGTLENPDTSITSKPGYTVIRMFGMDRKHYQLFIDTLGNLQIVPE
jgi:hypothetical protein